MSGKWVSVTRQINCNLNCCEDVWYDVRNRCEFMTREMNIDLKQLEVVSTLSGNWGIYVRINEH